MEGAHADIFKHGDQLCERHGELANAWATNAPLPGEDARRQSVEDKTKKIVDDLITEMNGCSQGEDVDAILARETVRKQVAWMIDKRPEEHARLFKAANTKRAALRDNPQPQSADAGALL